ncbi:MAG: TIM barrel protein [Candidatus Parcubacteria bacterium]|nr:TIM barrel protein [Candidatus Parcubacteria bacterium]
MKIGVKAGPNTDPDYINQIRNHADYLEIYAEINVDWDYKGLSKPGLPVLAVHVAHFDSGVNFANKSRGDLNRKAFDKAIEIANFFSSDKVVFHPELIEDSSDSLLNLIEFLKLHYDPRLLVENMPFSTDNQTHLCGCFEEIETLLLEAKVGFCLDFTHACEYAKRMGIDVNEMLMKLLSLHPAHFHLADTKLDVVFDPHYNEVHLNLWDGDLDIDAISSFLPESSEVTIETPQIVDKQVREITYLKYGRK